MSLVIGAGYWYTKKLGVNLYAGRFSVKLVEKRTHFFKVDPVEGKIVIAAFFAAFQQFTIA